MRNPFVSTRCSTETLKPYCIDFYKEKLRKRFVKVNNSLQKKNHYPAVVSKIMVLDEMKNIKRSKKKSDKSVDDLKQTI